MVFIFRVWITVRSLASNMTVLALDGEGLVQRHNHIAKCMEGTITTTTLTHPILAECKINKKITSCQIASPCLVASMAATSV